MMKYNKDNPLKVVTLCSGYDSQCLALERLKKNHPQFDYELIAWSEFDPESKAPLEKQPAVIAHNALFPQWADRNLGDMTKIDWENVPDFDLLFYSTPCQSISAAGLQHGFTEGSGTRSSIIWNVRDAVKIKRPKYLCLENVSAMISGKFIGMFNLWQLELERLGYANFLPPSFPLQDGTKTKSGCLNSKNYNCPQNRERVFLVSILREQGQPEPQYHFPKPFPLEKRLKDVLEEKVDERYYLSDKMLEYFNRVNDDDSHGHKFKPTDGGGQCHDHKGQPCRQRRRQLHILGKLNTSQDGVVVDADGIAPTHTAGHGNCPKTIEYE